MDGPGIPGARVARESREYHECKDDDFGNIGARGGFTQRRKVRKGGLARVGFNTKTEGDEGLTGQGSRVRGLPANDANIANAKTMASEILAREGFTQSRQVRQGGLARVGFNTKTEGNEV